MEPLSATVITFNEEANIERCLNSLIGVVSEIVVIDSHSVDATLDICRRYGCRITVRDFEGFGSQRQYATGLTTSRYVLSVDADEVLSEELRLAIMKLRREGFRHRMYSAEVQSYMCGRPMRHSGWGPGREVRLFDKRYANWDLRDVGERVTHSDSVIPEPLPGFINHYRCSSMAELEFKESRHARMRGRVLAAAGCRVGALGAWMRAAGAFIDCYLSLGAFLDGSAGRHIAARRYTSTLMAYRTARRITKEQEHK